MKDNIRKVKERGGSFQTGMSKMGKLTLGKLYLQGKMSIDVDVSKFVLNKWRQEEKEANDKVKRFFATYAKLESDVNRVRNIDLSKKKNGRYTGTELGVLLRWKLMNTEDKIKKMLLRCEVSGRAGKAAMI